MVLANPIAEALFQAETLTAAACCTALQEGVLSGTPSALPKAVWGGAFGDCSTAYPLAVAASLGRSPNEISAILAERIALEESFFLSAEAAGPGFLNFRLSPHWYETVIAAAKTAGPPTGTAVPLSDEEALRLLLNRPSGRSIDPELSLRRDRGNPLYRLRYAVRRLHRLPEVSENVKGIPFSSAEQELLKAAAACLSALRRAEADQDPRPAARCLLALTDALHSCHTACRTAGCSPHPHSLVAVQQVLEGGMAALGIQ